ncbi:phosphatase PAP2 family protein [Geobacter sp. SVR]|nr:phosphatase PAP2 family protein [Geobacter sp. SVR]GCF84264.1 phosphatase PAP2 family protein [Geobacter sp. SVR]
MAAVRLKDETISLLSQPVQRENIAATLGVVTATSLTYIFDKEIFEKLQTVKSAGVDKATNIGSTIGNPILHLGIAAGMYGLGIAADSPKWKETGEMVGEALILADASTFIIKEATGRGRPTVTAHKGDFKPFGFKNDYDSFPSMHTSSSFALASVMSATTESIPVKALYYSAATFVGFSRMQENKHWASDVVFGALLGELCGRVVVQYHVSGNKLAIAPQTYESGAGLALVGKW